MSTPEEQTKEEKPASTTSSPRESPTFGETDAPGTTASDAIRRNLEEMESSFFDSPTTRKSREKSTILVDTPETFQLRDPLSSGKSESRFSGLGITPIAGRTNTLALKEQENIVNKYQKENFDLKFRIYYMEKRLKQLTSDEAKRMIQENVELNVYKVSSQKELKALAKRVRELQFEINDKDARLEQQERAAQMQSRMDAERDGDRYDTEQELSFMRERISSYEIEISRLRDQVDEAARENGSDRSPRPRSHAGSVISLGRHEAEVESLEIANGQLRDALSETKMENQELTRQVETMNEDLAKLYEHVNANADDSILERSVSRSHARGASTGSARGLDAVEAEIEQLELSNGQLRDAQSLLRMQNIELTNQADFMTEEVTRLQHVADDYTKLQAAFEDLEGVYNELKDAYERTEHYEEQFNQTSAANAALQSQFEELRKEKQKAADWSKVLTARVEAMTGELTDFADMKQQFEELQDAHKKLQDNLDVTIKTLQKSERRQVEQVRKNATDKMKGLEDMISRKEAEMAVLRSENAGLNQHEGEMYTRMDEMLAKIEAAKKEAETYKADKENLAGLLEREKALRHTQQQQHQQQKTPTPTPNNDPQALTSIRNARISELESARATDKKRTEALHRQFQARLQELEKRLVQEREGRLVDRKGARARLLEGERENAELKETVRKLTERKV